MTTRTPDKDWLAKLITLVLAFAVWHVIRQRVELAQQRAQPEQQHLPH